MAGKYVKIHGKPILVSNEVYYAYYHMGRQRLTQEEKESRWRVASYDALDSEDHLGIDILVDRTAPGIEEIVIARATAEKLHQCLAQLPARERKLLEAIYFDDMSEREVAQTLGIPHMTVHNRKSRALRRLKELMKK